MQDTIHEILTSQWISFLLVVFFLPRFLQEISFHIGEGWVRAVVKVDDAEARGWLEGYQQGTDDGNKAAELLYRGPDNDPFGAGYDHGFADGVESASNPLENVETPDLPTLALRPCPSIIDPSQLTVFHEDLARAIDLGQASAKDAI